MCFEYGITPIVSEKIILKPELRSGMMFHLAALMLVLLIGGLSFWKALQQSAISTIPFWVIISIITFILIPFLLYRIYALQTSYYSIERGGISLHWGLRSEDIPMDTVIWVKQDSEASLTLESEKIPLPRMRMPGAVLGYGNINGGKSIEFLATRSSQLVVVATNRGYYAISPANPVEFMATYRHYLELGCLSPIEARSIYPTFLLMKVWTKPMARLLITGGLVFSVTLLIIVSVIVTTRTKISLGFTPQGGLREGVKSTRLYLFPIINGLMFIGSILLGLFFFRSGEARDDASDQMVNMEMTYGKNLAYLMWGSGAVTPLLFLLAIFFILRAG